MKGTLIKGTQPICNFRQARNRARDRSDTFNDENIGLEEFLMEIGSFDEDFDTSTPAINGNVDITRCQALGAQCDYRGRFLPTQCRDDLCWCVDEAGNQLLFTSSFQQGEQHCGLFSKSKSIISHNTVTVYFLAFTPVDAVEINLGVIGKYDDITAILVVNQIQKIIKNLNGLLDSTGVTTEIVPDILYVKFFLIGDNKVDVAYRLEQIVMKQQLPGMTIDVTKCRFTHLLGSPEHLIAEKIVAIENREIVSQSPVSIIAPYHTALIVIAASSAFVISVLTVIVILYKRKVTPFL